MHHSLREKQTCTELRHQNADQLRSSSISMEPPISTDPFGRWLLAGIRLWYQISDLPDGPPLQESVKKGEDHFVSSFAPNVPVHRRKQWIHTGDPPEIAGFPTDAGGFPIWCMFDSPQKIRSRPGKPNQRKGQNEKFMNFAHYDFWCSSLGSHGASLTVWLLISAFLSWL